MEEYLIKNEVEIWEYDNGDGRDAGYIRQEKWQRWRQTIVLE